MPTPKNVDADGEAAEGAVKTEAMVSQDSPAPDAPDEGDLRSRLSSRLQDPALTDEDREEVTQMLAILDGEDLVPEAPVAPGVTQIAYDGLRYPLDQVPTLNSREDIVAALDRLRDHRNPLGVYPAIKRAAERIGCADLVLPYGRGN